MLAARSRREGPIAVTMGDPAGIGLEITIKAWHLRQERQLHPFVLLADPEATAQRAAMLGSHTPIAEVAETDLARESFTEALPVLPVRLAARAVPGVADVANAQAVIAAIETGVDLVVTGRASALVTNPISKAVLTASGFPHPGHTEFLGALAEARSQGQTFRPVMMLASDELRVVPLTVHIPLAKVPSSLKRGLILETAHTTALALQRDFGVLHPRIAIAGLNPHAGEAATMGTEERDIIAPAIAELRAEGLAVSGPHPADTLFHEAARKGYDAVIAMYHDQALIPLKTLAFDRGVNVTLGLPFIRTSPDHGTAFDIAALGRANPESLMAALRMAADMAAARNLTRTARP